MTRIKHVLVLLILVLPMLALAPTLVASPNEALASPIEADTSLPAAFIEEILRVAVYVENDVSLPAYAEGGVYTNHSGNVISFLQGEGYAVTPMTGQDILDHKLLAAKYDAFVLPNQLPKDNVADLVKDYWLAGGGILSIGGSIGYLLYMGMIHPDLAGDFGLVGVGPTPYYWYDQPYGNISIEIRNPVTQSYEVDDIIIYDEIAAVWNWVDLEALIGSSFQTLALDDGDPDNGAIFSLDSDYQGGKIVQIPGNCSTIPVWERPIITDAIDWLAPKPKARVAFDYSHTPYYGVDSWDTVATHVPRYNIWRDFLVNHTFVCDKLYPTGSNLTAADLAPFDVLIISRPALNYSLIEMDLIRGWVEGGKSLFYLSDYSPLGQATMNELLMPWDINVTDGPNMGTFSTTDFGYHPTLEEVGSVAIAGGEWLQVSGSAYPIVNQSTDVAIAAAEPGLGRVIVSGDINWIDYSNYMNDDNLQFGINIINWLSASTAEVLFYVDNPMLIDPYYAPAVDALNDLGIPFYITSNDYYMNRTLCEQTWSLVILDSPWPGIGLYLDEISSYLDTGGDLIVSWHQAGSYSDHPLFAKIGFEHVAEFPDEEPFHIWNSDHGIFNYPNNYGALNFTAVEDYGDEGDLLTVFPNATALAGYTEANNPGNATTVLGFDGHALFNAYLIDQLNGDLDDSTFADNFELWENQIAFMYYDRPTINHPDDVTYMETETGNEISWTPAADAGPWEYVVKENGSIIESGHWNGGIITINVDGVNASITDYQLTVFDTLGYSVSDLVILNVTEYVEPTTTTTTGTGVPLDPMLLIIIGVGAVVVIVIIIIVMKKKK